MESLEESDFVTAEPSAGYQKSRCRIDPSTLAVLTSKMQRDHQEQHVLAPTITASFGREVGSPSQLVLNSTYTPNSYGGVTHTYSRNPRRAAQFFSISTGDGMEMGNDEHPKMDINLMEFYDPTPAEDYSITSYTKEFVQHRKTTDIDSTVQLPRCKRKHVEVTEGSEFSKAKTKTSKRKEQEEETLKRLRESLKNDYGIDSEGAGRQKQEEEIERDSDLSSYNNGDGRREEEEDDFALEVHLSTILNSINDIKKSINECLKRIDSGGRIVIEKASIELEKTLQALGTVTGHGNDCFLCMFGNRKYDQSTYDKTNRMYKILEDNLFTEVAPRAIAIAMYNFYINVIYVPGLEEGLYFPRWSVKGVENHIWKHMRDPRIKLLKRQIRLEVLADILTAKITSKDLVTGEIEVNERIVKMYHDTEKLYLTLLKTEPRMLVGFDDSLGLKPALSYINAKMHVE